MSEHDREEEENPAVVERAREASDCLIVAVQLHEQEDHGGEVCMPNRCGMLAFLAHSIGLTVNDMLAVAEMLALYDRRHHERFGSNGNGNGNGAG